MSGVTRHMLPHLSGVPQLYVNSPKFDKQFKDFWKVGLSDVVLSKYPNKSHNFENLTLMTSSL